METELWIALIGAATTIGSSVISWLLAKRKYHNEIEEGMIHNMDNSLEFYKKLSDDNKARLDDLSKRNEFLEAEVQELRKQVLDLTMNICMDLTCRHRVREVIKRNRVVKHKDRLDMTNPEIDE